MCVFFCFSVLFAFLYLVSALPVVFIFLRESFAVLEQCYSTAFFLKVTDFFNFNFTFFFVNVHYLEDCTLRECLQFPTPALNSGGFARVYSGTFQGFAVRFTTFKSESSCEGGRFLFFTSE